MDEVPHAINIYTDGSFKMEKGRKGGFGISIHYPDETKESILKPGYLETSIPRMELKACIETVKEVQKNKKIIESKINYICIHSDSKYVVENYKKAMFGNLIKRDSKTVSGEEWANVDLWKKFVREVKKAKKYIEIKKIPAHSGIEGNVEADKIAEISRNWANIKDFANPTGVTRRYLPIKEKKLDTINTKQSMFVYIVRSIPRSTLYSANGQILKPKKYLGVKIKIIGNINNQTLHTGHIYLLKLNIDKNNKLIIKTVVKDIGKPSENKYLYETNTN